jgi:hypothetical protein
MLHTYAMTMPDLGAERPGQASETRQMVERGRTQTGADVSGKAFAIALIIILLAISLLILLFR